MVIDGQDFVTATPAQITATVADFLHGNQHAQVKTAFHAEGALRKAKGFASIGLLPGDLGRSRGGRRDGRRCARAGRVPFPEGAERRARRRARLRDPRRAGQAPRGYRIDWRTDALGSYYGIEGMTWTDPPLFKNASTQTIGKVQYLLVNDGSHIHDVGWRAHGMLYWISNTEREGLTNPQMLSLARSASLLKVRRASSSQASRPASPSRGTSGLSGPAHLSR